MATPNDPNPAKKPNPSVPPGKAPPPKPASGVQPPAKPGAGQPPAGKPPAAKPPAGKPAPAAKAGNGAPAAKKPATGPAKKPAAKTARDDGSNRGGKRRLGQILIDLGFIDDDQLWDVLDEAKTTGLPTGQVAVRSGPGQRGPAAPGPGRAARPEGRQPRGGQAAAEVIRARPRDHGRRLQDPAALAQGQESSRSSMGDPPNLSARGQPAQPARASTR